MKITIRKVNNIAGKEQAGTYEEKELIKGTVLLSDNFSSADYSHKLILVPSAVQEIFSFIEWDIGQRHDVCVEQGGILIGKRYYDKMQDIHFVIVTKAITADGAEGSTAYLNIDHECWRIMHDKMDRYIQNTGEDAVIVGWFHTHPNILPCFMSETDRNTQNLFFDGNNTYSVVINPQRHLIKAFRAKECVATQAFFLFDIPSDVGE